MDTFLLLVLVIASAILYRMGGSKWYPKAWRRVGCTITTALALMILGYTWWHILICLPFVYVSLTTYHDWLAPDGSSENWLCWLVTGLCYGLSLLPLAILSGAWGFVLLRSLILGIATMAWSEIISNDIVEETGRGALINLTMLI